MQRFSSLAEAVHFIMDPPLDYFGDIVSEGFFRAISHLETILKGSFYQNGGPMKKSLQKENMSTLK